MTPRDVRLFLVTIDTAFQRPKMAPVPREEVFGTRGQAPALSASRSPAWWGVVPDPPISSPCGCRFFSTWEGRKEGSWALSPAPEAAVALVRARPWGRTGEE